MAPRSQTRQNTRSVKQQHGQFFTVDQRVQRLMTSLVRKRTGAALEPSAGAGDLAAVLLRDRPGLDLTCVELDTTLPWDLPVARHHAEFLSWSSGRDGSFDVVFANPPYVAWKDCLPSVRAHAATLAEGWHGKLNLYHLFIERCAELLTHGGEMVFIVPTDWMFQTATAALRDRLLALGALTHLVHVGEERVFPDADVPSLCIFRFQRGSHTRTLRYRRTLEAAWETRSLVTSGSRWMVLEDAVADLVATWRPLGEQFDVRVGMVTGLDAAFRIDPATVEAETVRMLLGTSQRLEAYLDVNDRVVEEEIPPLALAHLREHRAELLARRIRRFDETNWWQWGAIRNADAMASRTPRFYVPAKTRQLEPFFSYPGRHHFAAGLLGLFKRPGALPIQLAVQAANSAEFRAVLEGMMLTTNDKLQLQPATLADAPFPTARDQVSDLTRRTPA